ncbi:hypothetical protein GCM10028773_21000 [Spirosoma koreense]
MWDKLISKYASIWIWSILFGLNATINFSLVETAYERDYGSLIIIIIIIVILCFSVVLNTWFKLLRFFIDTIVPLFFETLSEEEEIVLKKNNSKHLIFAFRSIIYSSALLIAIGIAKGIILNIRYFY